MKAVLIATLFSVLIVASIAVGSQRTQLETVERVSTAQSGNCPLCIDFMVAAINYYLNYWLQITLPKTCTQLCAIVDPQHNSTCNLYCNLYGIYGFIQFLQRVDIDPIYMCQLEKQCEIKECATDSCATIMSMTVQPQNPKRGDKVTITGYYTVTGDAGAGMLSLRSKNPASGGSKGPTNYLVSSYRPGQYQAVYTLSTEQMPRGNWTSSFLVCMGGCGSSWPYSKLFDEKAITWHLA